MSHLQALEQTGGASDDFQENVAADKEVLKRKFSIDDALEDKICDLYDFYIEVLYVFVYSQVKYIFTLISVYFIRTSSYCSRGWRKIQDCMHTGYMQRYSLSVYSLGLILPNTCTIGEYKYFL